MLALELGFGTTALPKPGITTAAFSAAVLTGKPVVLGRLLGLLEGAGFACPPGLGRPGRHGGAGGTAFPLGFGGIAVCVRRLSVVTTAGRWAPLVLKAAAGRKTMKHQLNRNNFIFLLFHFHLRAN